EAQGRDGAGGKRAQGGKSAADRRPAREGRRRLPSLVGALRPRNAGRLRDPGRDLEGDRQPTSGHLGCRGDAAGHSGHRESRRLSSLSERAVLPVAARQWLSYYLVFIEGRLEEGVAHAQRAVELDPLAPLLVMQLGMTLMGAGRYEEAAAPLKRAADLAPTMFLPTIHLGLLYNHLGRSEEAIAPLEVAVTASGRHPWTLSALAVCYSALG